MRYKCKHASCGWMFEQFHMLQWDYSLHHSPESNLDEPSEKAMEDAGTMEKDAANNVNPPPYEPHSNTVHTSEEEYIGLVESKHPRFTTDHARSLYQ